MVFKSYSKNEKEMVLEKLLKDLKFLEDMKDILTVLERGEEKSVSYMKVHEELKKTKAAKSAASAQADVQIS